jgi:hypothetical protein
MVSGTGTLDASAVLAEARAARSDAHAAEARVLAKAVEWAHLHVVDDVDGAATWWAGRGLDTGIPIAGEGCPLISEFAIPELAAALGLSQESGRRFLAVALELAHRLPRLWLRVQEGSLAPWRARRIAEETLDLSPEAAAHVDIQISPFAHRTGMAQTQRLVDEAIARFMPAYAAERREAAADQRKVFVDTQQISFAGTARIEAEVDLADALDFDDAVARDAERQRALGSTETLDARRAQALGNLARRQLALDLDAASAEPAGTPTDAGDEAAATAKGQSVRRGRARARDIVLYVHLTDEVLRTRDPNTPVTMENGGGHLLTAGQIAQWCGRPDTDRIVVKNVVDLNENLHTDGYTPSAALAEQVRLRDKSCVFPHCHRSARRCDLDHVIPYDAGGSTSSDNLAPLCRLHHRLKTHGGWTYQMLDLGVLLWVSPYGYRYRRDANGTTDLTSGPVPAPQRPAEPPDE